MASVDENMQLNAEMATISAVTSEELLKLSKNASDLERFQNKLDDANNGVAAVKAILTDTKPHEVTVDLATTLDNYLERAEVEIPPVNENVTVQGTEELGYTLTPRDYLFTRLLGCENFLADFFKKSKEVTTRISIAFREGYILFTESQDSLEAAIDLLEQTVKTMPNFDKGTSTIALGSRLFNLFKVGDKVDEDWIGNLSKLSRTISGISGNHYLNSKNTLNSTMAYFGGFADATQEEAIERLKMLPVSIPSERFKECTYPNRDHTTSGATAKQSVELMGGAYFLDVRQNAPRQKINAVEDVGLYVDRYTEFDYTGFENSSNVIFPKLGNEVKTLSSEQIHGMIKLFRVVMADWRKVFEGAEKFKLSDSDYVDIAKGIYESQLDETTKSNVADYFSAIVRKNQMELLALRTAVNTYLVLIINGLIELGYTSIKANPTE